MSDCLFDAFRDALWVLGDGRGRGLRGRDYQRYRAIKDRWQPNPAGYTEIALAPHIIRSLAALYGLRVNVEHRLFTVEQARQAYWWQERNVKTWLASYRWPDWGKYVEELTLPNAIYLSVFSKHAYFRHEPVTAGHLMALQLVRP